MSLPQSDSTALREGTVSRLKNIHLQLHPTLHLASNGEVLAPPPLLRTIDFDRDTPESVLQEAILKRENESPLWPQMKAKTEKAWKEYLELIPVAKEAVVVATPTKTSPLGGQIVVTTLGTGSAVPSIYRNGG